MEASLKQEKDKNEEVLVSHNTDLIDAAASLKHHQEELNNFSQWQCEAKHQFEVLEAGVSSLDLECHSKKAHIKSLEENFSELCSLMEEMESRLCRCADKENERSSSVEVKVEEEEVIKDEPLEYASNDEYQTPPMGVLQKLHLIKDVPDRVIHLSGPHSCCLE